MRHVAPHRWADADAGRLAPAELSELERHAERCPRCASARDKVLAVRDGFAAVRDKPAPHLNWEHIGARIYWVTSSERRAAVRGGEGGRRLARWTLVAAGAAVAAGVLLWVLRDGSAPAADPTAAVPVAPAPAPAPAPPAPPAAAPALTGVVTLVQGAVELDGAELGIDGRIRPGARLLTGEGRVAFQIDHDSGILLGPGSSLQLRAFDDRQVDLAVDGEVSIQLAPRRPDQRFTVTAGDRVVSVRGTAFRVRHRDGGVEVDCSHGHVVVSGGAADVDVRAGERLILPAGGQLAARQSQLMDAPRVAEVGRATALPLLPVWAGADAVYASSAALELAGLPSRTVEVDGVVRGTGSMQLRVMSGRHHVRYGARGTGSWLELGPGSRGAVMPPVAAAPMAMDRPQPAGIAGRERRAQLARAVGRDGRVRQCLSALEKQGLLEGAFVLLDVGVNASGRLDHLNIVSTNVTASAARCVRDTVDLVELPAGPAATLRYRVAF